MKSGSTPLEASSSPGKIRDEATKPCVLKTKVVDFTVWLDGFLPWVLCSSRHPPTTIYHDADAERPCNLGLAFAELRHFLGLMQLGIDFLW